MSTFEKAYNSVNRRRTSVGRDPRVPLSTTSAHSRTSSSFSRRPSVASPPAWDGRINVEEKAPMKIVVQPAAPSITTPPNSTVSVNEAEPEAKKKTTKAVKKTKTVKKKTKTAKAPTQGKSAATSTTASVEPPRRTKKPRTSVSSSTSATVKPSSLSTAPVTSASAATAHRRLNSFHESPGDRGRQPPPSQQQQQLCSLPSNDYSHHGFLHHGGDIELAVSSQSGSPVTSEFDFKMEQTPMSASPTSHAISSAAAVSAPPTSTARTPADTADFVKAGPTSSSRPLSMPDDVSAPTNLCAAPRTASISSAPSPCASPSSAAVVVPPLPLERVRMAEAGSSTAGGSDGHDHYSVLHVSADSSSEEGEEEESDGDREMREEEEQEQVVTSPNEPFYTSPPREVVASDPVVESVKVVETKEKASETGKSPAADKKVLQEAGAAAKSAAANPADNYSGSTSEKTVKACAAVNEKDEEVDVYDHISSDSSAPSTQPASRVVSMFTAAVAQLDKAEHERPVRAPAPAAPPPFAEITAKDAKDAEKKEEAAPATSAEGADAVADAVEATSSPPPPPEAPQAAARLPHFMTGTNARPVVGIATANTKPTTTTASTSRARARLALGLSPQNLPSSPLSQPVAAPSPSQPRLVTPPPQSRSPPRQSDGGGSTAASRRSASAAVPPPPAQVSSPQMAPSPARFSRTSSLADCATPEDSVARRRARRAAVTAAAARQSSQATLPQSAHASALRRTNSEPINARAYEERQRSLAKAAQGPSSSVASSRRHTPANHSLASPPPPESSPVISLDAMDRCIYQAVMVDPPSRNERVEMPPVMERPLSYYEQGMYTRHGDNTAAHYRKALTHEQHALLRNTMWMPMTNLFDQRSGGVGAMMMDDLRHMARVIRYAQELENWKGALTQRAKYDAHCNELLLAAAAVRHSTLANSMTSSCGAAAGATGDGGSTASPKAASPSVQRDNFQSKGIYGGEDADALEMSTAAAALGDPNAKARGASPSPQKPSESSPAASVATTTAAAAPAATTAAASSASATRAAVKNSAGSAAHPTEAAKASQRRHASSRHDARTSSAHNPDYSDSDVEDRRGEGGLRSARMPTRVAAEGGAQPSAGPTAASSRGTTTLAAPAKTTTDASRRAASTPATVGRSGASAKKAEEKASKKKKTEEEPTFLDWLANAFGVKKKHKKDGEDDEEKDKAKKSKKSGRAKDDKKTAHSKSKLESTPAAATTTTAKSKSHSKSATATAPTSQPQHKPAATTASCSAPTTKVKESASPRAPATAPPTTTEKKPTASPSPASARTHPPKEQQAPAQQPSSAKQKSEPHPASPSPHPIAPTAQDAAAQVEASSAPAQPARDGTVLSIHSPSYSYDRAHDAPSAVPTTADPGSPFIENVQVSRFQMRSARCCSVDLPPPPIPVFRLYIFHPLEVIQELKRMVWWAATHHFFVFRVLTGTTAAATTASTMRGSVSHESHPEEDDTTGSVSRRRKRRAAALVEADRRAAATAASAPQKQHNGDHSASHGADHRKHHHSHQHQRAKDDEYDHGDCSSSSSSSSADSRSPSMDSADGGAGAKHEAVYFNTVLLNLRIDRWLVRHVVLTRRDATRGLVELEVTELTEAEAADAVMREEEMREAAGQSAQASPDWRTKSAMTYFFNSETRTPR